MSWPSSPPTAPLRTAPTASSSRRRSTSSRARINRIADSANFNGIKLLDGSMSANATTKLTSTATNSKAGVDLNIVADSVYDAAGKRTELDFSLSVTTTANSAGVSVDENGTVLITVMGKDADGISAEEIQAMLAKPRLLTPRLARI